MIECAKRDLGLIQLPLCFLQEHLDSGELIEVLPEYQATNPYVFYPKYAHPQPKLQKFIEFFLKSISLLNIIFLKNTNIENNPSDDT